MRWWTQCALGAAMILLNGWLGRVVTEGQRYFVGVENVERRILLNRFLCVVVGTVFFIAGGVEILGMR